MSSCTTVPSSFLVEAFKNRGFSETSMKYALEKLVHNAQDVTINIIAANKVGGFVDLPM